ncbi:hypothetical protein LC724_02855 [Blautia sp. RD014234]|nr:hypothetical protein [Blautia parvula]
MEPAAFLRKRKYFHKMAVLMESLDKKYLFPMVWKDADTWEEAGYYCLMKECTKSMLEETEEAQRLQKEYRERLETFVHDMKQPISVVSLIAGREKTQDNRAILLELEKMNHLSEQHPCISGAVKAPTRTFGYRRWIQGR